MTYQGADEFSAEQKMLKSKIKWLHFSFCSALNASAPLHFVPVVSGHRRHSPNRTAVRFLRRRRRSEFCGRRPRGSAAWGSRRFEKTADSPTAEAKLQRLNRLIASSILPSTISSSASPAFSQTSRRDFRSSFENGVITQSARS